ncbi:protein lifeguard 1-like [Schistocerca serialis cubense]|uniref:protein lifeguard 1-like n=1 Tax=Schistocerca serialis cubense TaxID=2023355 RepID=UPI00214F17DA|nr:protein lifeguard 1-like [Schistocerca serialis cubense]
MNKKILFFGAAYLLVAEMVVVHGVILGGPPFSQYNPYNPFYRNPEGQYVERGGQQDDQQQQDNPQVAYPQTTYPQLAYSAATYPRVSYPQAIYPQVSYPQATYPQLYYTG